MPQAQRANCARYWHVVRRMSAHPVGTRFSEQVCSRRLPTASAESLRKQAGRARKPHLPVHPGQAWQALKQQSADKTSCTLEIACGGCETSIAVVRADLVSMVSAILREAFQTALKWPTLPPIFACPKTGFTCAGKNNRFFPLCYALAMMHTP